MALPPPLPRLALPPRLPGESADRYSPTALRSGRSMDLGPGTASSQTFQDKLERGERVSFDSTNVNWLEYHPVRSQKPGAPNLPIGNVIIEFVSGATYQYRNVPKADVLSLIHSSSKGRFAYYEIRGAGPSPSRKGKSLPPWNDFQMIRGPWRSTSQVKAMVKAREPQKGTFAARRTYTVRTGTRSHSIRGSGGKPVVI